MPKAVFAEAEPANLSANSMAGGIFYTENAPGRWKGKEKSHLPIIEVERKSGNVSVIITTSHGMHGYDHYIVKHILLDGNYDFLGEKMFNPSKDKAPISKFSLGKYNGPIYALSVCNKHDVWLDVEKV